jgi:hypothetical protein
MFLLSKEGNRHLLEFLRNLTPQVLLLSTCLILYILWRKNPDSYVYLVLSVAIAVMCIAAIAANANNFLDNAFSHSAAIAAERDRLKAAASNGRASIRQIIRYIWREKRGTFFELAIAVIFLYSALFAILVTAVATASRALQ